MSFLTADRQHDTPLHWRHYAPGRPPARHVGRAETGRDGWRDRQIRSRPVPPPRRPGQCVVALQSGHVWAVSRRQYASLDWPGQRRSDGSSRERCRLPRVELGDSCRDCGGARRLVRGLWWSSEARVGTVVELGGSLGGLRAVWGPSAAAGRHLSRPRASDGTLGAERYRCGYPNLI